MKQKHPMKSTKSLYLDNANCHRYKYTCSGVKVCGYLHPDIQSMHHTSLSPIQWERIKQLRENDDCFGSQQKAKSNRYNYFRINC